MVPCRPTDRLEVLALSHSTIQQSVAFMIAGKTMQGRTLDIHISPMKKCVACIQGRDLWKRLCIKECAEAGATFKEFPHEWHKRQLEYESQTPAENAIVQKKSSSGSSSTIGFLIEGKM